MVPFLGLLYRILNINRRKELITMGLRVGTDFSSPLLPVSRNTNQHPNLFFQVILT